MSVRLFVAADLPDDVRDALVAWRPSDDALRPVAPEYLHVTLAFLGACEESLVDAIGAAAVACAAPVGSRSASTSWPEPWASAVDRWNGSGPPDVSPGPI